MRRPTRAGAVGVALTVTCAVAVAAAPAGWAHSPTDFLKVSVGHPSTVLLPPMRSLPGGRLEITISAPAAFRLQSVSAGAGWRTRVSPEAAVLDGRRAAGRTLLVTVTGVAQRSGRLPLDVRVVSPSAPSEAYHWQLTALAGYAQPTSSGVGTSRPDAPVAIAGAAHRLWPVSLAFALVALLVLVVRRRPRVDTQ